MRLKNCGWTRRWSSTGVPCRDARAARGLSLRASQLSACREVPPTSPSDAAMRAASRAFVQA